MGGCDFGACVARRRTIEILCNMNGLPKTPADTQRLAEDVMKGELPFAEGVGELLSLVLKMRYPQLRSMSLLSASGAVSLVLRLDCNFRGRDRRVKLEHHLVVPEIMPESVTVDVRPKVQLTNGGQPT